MIEHVPGVIVEATVPVAARLITKKTHRVATPEEHEAYKIDLAERTDELRRQELEKKGVATHVTPVEVGRPAKLKEKDK